MQLHLDREELQLLAEVLEGREFELRQQARDRPADAAVQRQLSDLEAVMKGVLHRRLQFDADELDMLNGLLGELCGRARAHPPDPEWEPRCRRLEAVREKIAEVCTMI